MQVHYTKFYKLARQMQIRNGDKLMTDIMDSKPLRISDGEVVCHTGSENSCRLGWITSLDRVNIGVHEHAMGFGNSKREMMGCRELLELHTTLHGPMKKLLTIKCLPQKHVACLKRKL